MTSVFEICPIEVNGVRVSGAIVTIESESDKRAVQKTYDMPAGLLNYEAYLIVTATSNDYSVKALYSAETMTVMQTVNELQTLAHDIKTPLLDHDNLIAYWS